VQVAEVVELSAIEVVSLIFEPIALNPVQSLGTLYVLFFLIAILTPVPLMRVLFPHVYNLPIF